MFSCRYHNKDWPIEVSVLLQFSKQENLTVIPVLFQNPRGIECACSSIYAHRSPCRKIKGYLRSPDCLPLGLQVVRRISRPFMTLHVLPETLNNIKSLLLELMWLVSDRDFSNIPDALALFEADSDAIVELVGRPSAPSQRRQLPVVTSTSNPVTLSTTAPTTTSQGGSAAASGRSVPMEVCGHISTLYFSLASQVAQPMLFKWVRQLGQSGQH